MRFLRRWCCENPCGFRERNGAEEDDKRQRVPGTGRTCVPDCRLLESSADVFVFTLRVPADPRFRGLPNEVVARYVDLAGIPDAERETVSTALTAALDGLGAAPAEAVDVVCTMKAAGFDITVRCGGRSAVVHHPQPAAKR